MSLSDVVNITISRQTTGVTRAGFGYALIVGPHVHTTDRVNWYNKADWSAAMLADNFVATEALYLAAQSYFSADPSPTKVAIGRRNASQVDIAIDTVSDNTEYGVTVKSGTAGTPHKYTSDGTATKAEIIDGLLALINAGAEASYVTASNVGPDTHLRIVTDGADPMAISLAEGSTLMTIEDPAGTIEDADTALAACLLADQDWYAVVSADHTQAQVEKVAAWVEANEKLHITASSAANIKGVDPGSDSTTIAAVVKAAAYARTGVIYSAVADSKFPDAAWFGTCLPKTPGAVNWAFKTLSGVTVDSLTATERKRVWDKYASTYETVAGVNITRWGNTGSGEYFDIIRGIDWLKARMTERIYSLFVNQDKIPFTDKGIGSIEAEIRATLEEAIENEVLAIIDYVVSPLAEDVSSADKALRKLTGMKFKATLAGAVNTVEITGIVTV